jgi:simple sugar transport system ATP-binding protein
MTASTGVCSIRMSKIMKFFPENGAKALEGADLCIRTGEIHALLGENGAGKSSLMHILAGSLLPDSGEIIIDGAPVHFSSPAGALSAGIGIVRQRPALIHGLSVWEDCILGAEKGAGHHFPATIGAGRLFLPYKKRARDFVRETADLYGIGLPLDAESASLSAGERQMAGVLALLLRDTRFLIFDEATAVLDGADSGRLFALWRRLAASGRGVVLISHKLEEVFALAAQVTVLRKGRTAASLPASECSEKRLIALMFGEDLPDTLPAAGALSPTAARGFPVLNVENLSVRSPGFPLLRNISLSVGTGEILGVAGVKESGTETLELALSRFLPVISGTIMLDGSNISTGGTGAFRAAGGACLSAGRHRISPGRGIASSDRNLSIRDNLLIHAYSRLVKNGLAGKLGILSGKKIKKWTDTIMSGSALRTKARAKAMTLSGGMLQRMLGVREFAENPVFIIMVEPAWGLDYRRRERFYHFLQEKTEKGCGVLLFFSDIDELLSICDRILVLHGGECAALLANDDKLQPETTKILKKKIKNAMAGLP